MGRHDARAATAQTPRSHIPCNDPLAAQLNVWRPASKRVTPSQRASPRRKCGPTLREEVMMFVLVFYLLSLGFFNTSSDDGVGIDPHGVHATARSDGGGAMDPNGKPDTVQYTTDEGNGLDPHGKP